MDPSFYTLYGIVKAKLVLCFGSFPSQRLPLVAGLENYTQSRRKTQRDEGVWPQGQAVFGVYKAGITFTLDLVI